MVQAPLLSRPIDRGRDDRWKRVGLRNRRFPEARGDALGNYNNRPGFRRGLWDSFPKLLIISQLISMEVAVMIFK